MDTLFIAISITVFVAALAIGWGLTLMGLPGNWLMVAAAALYAWLSPTGLTQLTWTTVIVMAALATAGEIAELAAGVWGARRAGGSRRAAIWSLLGSIAGALVGAAIGMPIPLVGPPLAAMLGGALGALAGAALAETTRGEASGQSLRVGGAAFVGRLLGTGAKTFVATVLAVVAVVALVV
jgi:uncharacterized protein YqgC (DUF456 family)